MHQPAELSVGQVTVAHDLFWWRCAPDGWQTTVSFYWPGPTGVRDCVMHCRWFEDGQETARWDRALEPGAFVVIDSRSPPVPGVGQVREAVLSIEVQGCAGDGGTVRRRRLFGMIDWCHPTEGIVTLHSDHCVLEAPQERGLTEIVLRPWDQRRPELVFMTADNVVPRGSLQLIARNPDGATRSALVDQQWEPWRVHRVDLQSCFGDLAEFAGGQEGAVSGTRAAMNVFARPYVVAEGPVRCTYHGGDLYRWPAMPRLRHVLLGEGEVNPIFVLLGDQLDTAVSFLNTHGDLEEDFWIGVRLYDRAGGLVTHEPRWRLARRNVSVSASFAELVPPSNRPFVGHAAFTFSEPDRAYYPGRLQALMAYSAPGSCSRVMVWSDEWNTPARQRRVQETGGHYLSYYRVWCQPDAETWVAITNAGDADLREAATYRLILRDEDGDEIAATRTLGPLATDWGPVGALIEGATNWLSHRPSAILLVESTSDLAMVALDHHFASGRWSAEHFMSAPVPIAGGDLWPAGN